MSRPEWLTSAIARLLITKPYLAPIAIRIDWREKPGLGTVAVDTKGRGYYEPNLDQVRPEWAQFMPWIIEHELHHILRRHHERGEAIGASLKDWNLATDAEINDDLGIEVPNLVYPETIRQPRGLLAEDYYNGILHRHQSVGSEGGDQDDDSDENESEGDGAEGSSEGEDDKDEKSDKSEKSSENEGTASQDQATDGSEGQGDHDAQDNAVRPGCGGLKEPDPSDDRPGWTEQERKAIEREVAREIARQVRRGRGTGIGSELLQWASEQLQPLKDHWTIVLERMIAGAISMIGRDIERSRRLSGRTTQWALRWRYRQAGGKIGVLVDVSGSMLSDLPLAFSVVQRVASSRDFDLIIMACDEQPSGPYKSLDDLVERARGGGGTDLRNGFGALVEQGCDAIFVITDGLTPWPDTIDVPVLVGLTEECPDVPFPTVLLKEERRA